MGPDSGGPALRCQAALRPHPSSVDVHVVVIERIVYVAMVVAFSEQQHDTDAHEHTGSHVAQPERLG